MTLYTIELQFPGPGPTLWAYPAPVGWPPERNVLMTMFEERAAVLDEDQVIEWLNASAPHRGAGCKARVRVATPARLRALARAKVERMEIAA